MKKLLGILLLTSIFSGCASVNNNDQSIAELSQKIDELTSEVGKLKQQQQQNSQAIEQTKSMAEKAAEDSQASKQRIDNFIASYKK